MERFLEKNEGLRSRIAFHIVFPDYNADELCDILKLMSKKKGYMLDEEAENKCRVIFEVACQNAEFGNGRFVRNVLEQAIIKQSSRIASELQNDTYDKQMCREKADEAFPSYRKDPEQKELIRTAANELEMICHTLFLFCHANFFGLERVLSHCHYI